jgi:hypothetical protein
MTAASVVSRFNEGTQGRTDLWLTGEVGDNAGDECPGSTLSDLSLAPGHQYHSSRRHAADAPALLPETDGAAPNQKASAGNGLGASVAAGALVEPLVVIASRVSWPLRPRHDSHLAAPAVLLLDHPG